MGLEVVVPGEALVALGALEGLLPGVGPLVVLKDVLVAEGPQAHSAGKDLVARSCVLGRRFGTHRVRRTGRGLNWHLLLGLGSALARPLYWLRRASSRTLQRLL